MKKKILMLIAVDVNKIERIGKMSIFFENEKNLRIYIDHHMEPDNNVDYIFANPAATSTCEVLYNFITETNIVEIDDSIALPIYTGIAGDTGFFQYERTNSYTFKIVRTLNKI